MDRVKKQLNGYHIEVANGKVKDRKIVEFEKREQGCLRKIGIITAMEKVMAKLRDEIEAIELKALIYQRSVT